MWLDAAAAERGASNTATERRVAIRNWRNKLPFSVPVDPDLMSFEPRLVNSATEKLIHDRGVTSYSSGSINVPEWCSPAGVSLLIRDLGEQGRSAEVGASSGGDSYGSWPLAKSHLSEYFIGASLSRGGLADRMTPHHHHVLSRDVDRGIVGCSLAKHSAYYRMTEPRYYPGIFA